MLRAPSRAPELMEWSEDGVQAEWLIERGGPADVWSVAAILLQCITGVEPYANMGVNEVQRAHILIHAPGCIPDDQPLSLQNLLRQSFDAVPADRPEMAVLYQVNFAISCCLCFACVVSTVQIL